MKKTLLFAALLAAAFAVSCEKKDAPEAPASGKSTRTFTCVLDNSASSRYSISEAGKVRWEAGDEILIHGEYIGVKNDVIHSTVVTLSATDISADGKTATINVDVDETGADGVKPYVRSDYASSLYAMYPASAALATEGYHTYYYTVFSQPNNPLLIAYDSGSTFKFTNVCSVVSFKATGSFDSYTFSGNNEETVSYAQFAARYAWQSEDDEERCNIPYSSLTNGASAEVSGEFESGKDIFIYIPAGVSFTGGFTVKFWSGSTLAKVAKSTAPVDLPRGSYLPLGDITSHLKDYQAPDTGDHHSSIPTAGAVDLSAEGSANCYIVYDGGTYKLPAVKGNGSESIGDIASTEVVWETFNNDETPEAGTFVSQIDFEDGWIYMVVPDEVPAGNALVAAKDANGKILWSWHIWFPQDTVGSGEYGIAQVPMLDRSIGALEVVPESGAATSTCQGLLYQWGRKDPFVGVRTAGTRSVARVSGKAWENGSSLSIAQSIASPTTFGGTSSDWTTESNEDLWGGSLAVKTIYDPCPAGYKVPTADDLPGLQAEELVGFEYLESEYRFSLGSPKTWFPQMGYINSDGSYSRATRSVIWLAVQAGSDAGSCAYVYEGPGYATSVKKSCGGTVRCVAE